MTNLFHKSILFSIQVKKGTDRFNFSEEKIGV